MKMGFGVKPFMAFGLLVLTGLTVAQFSDDTPSLVLDNHSIITDKKTKTFIDQNLQDLFTMFRSYRAFKIYVLKFGDFSCFWGEILRFLKLPHKMICRVSPNISV